MAVTDGRIKHGSGTVRSVNHRHPPVFILSTGSEVIPLVPIKTDINTGICEKSKTTKSV